MSEYTADLKMYVSDIAACFPVLRPYVRTLAKRSVYTQTRAKIDACADVMLCIVYKCTPETLARLECTLGQLDPGHAETLVKQHFCTLWGCPPEADRVYKWIAEQLYPGCTPRQGTPEFAELETLVYAYQNLCN